MKAFTLTSILVGNAALPWDSHAGSNLVISTSGIRIKMENVEKSKAKIQKHEKKEKKQELDINDKNLKKKFSGVHEQLQWNWVYEGTFYYHDQAQKEIRHGEGTCTFSKGSEDKGTYEGSWVDDKMHGKGKYTFPSGARYDGEWLEGKMHGKGKYTYLDGGLYDGEWLEGKRHGKGKYTYAIGFWYDEEDLEAWYDGDWFEGKRHGEGRLLFLDGSWYSGGWAEDVRHGSFKAFDGHRVTWGQYDMFGVPRTLAKRVRQLKHGDRE